MSFREDGAAALEWAAQYLERVGDFPVLAQVAPGDIRSRLPATPPERGEPFADVLRDLDEILLPGTTHWQSPRFFAYFANSAAEPGILAELLAATLNSVAFIWRTSPASTELEAHTLDWTAQLLGLPSGWHGHIEDTASISTIAALAAAREATGGRVVVCSEEAHSSVERAARLLGLETRKVPLDDEFRLDAGALDLTDAAALVATVGTTSTTAVDPVPVLADACEAAGVWLHVDAAYAGSAWVCPELRWSQAGVERGADSLVVNAHKWLFTPMDCSLLWTRKPEALRAAFSLVPEYLGTSEEAESLSDYGPALGRRFRSLKLWAVLRCYGREGLQARIRETVRLAELFETWVGDEPGWEVCAPRRFSVVCFRRDGGDDENEAVLERVNRSGEAFLSHTRLNGRYVIRLAIGGERTTQDDVRRAWDALTGAAAD
ncbi:MAG: aminotransferase class V-fold PLP-dependent enzyme [Actinomycetota bacterium]|nr:aminotransferase class V-fold PLP-dependent enzyme [Actinomycetota bacterium]